MRASIIIASAVASIASNAIAQTARYTGNGNPNNQWQVSANWENGAVPNNPNMDVQIGTPGSFQVIAGIPLGPAFDTEIHNLTLGSGSSLTLSNGADSSFIVHGSSVANNGTINIPDQGDLLIDSQTTFSGTGSIVLSAGSVISSNDPTNEIARLVNQSNTIRGVGNIGFNSDIRLSNLVGGIIRAKNSNVGITITPFGGVDSIINQGLIESDNATLTISNGANNPGGVVQINNVGGTIGARYTGSTRLNGQIVHGGVLSASDAGTIRLTGVTSNNVNFNVGSGSTFNLTGGSHSASISNAGFIDIYDNVTLNPTAPINNTGDFRVRSNAGMGLILGSDASFTGNGTLTLMGSTTAFIDGDDDGEVETLHIGANQTLKGVGKVGFGQTIGSLRIVNEGTIGGDGTNLEIVMANGPTIENINAGVIGGDNASVNLHGGRLKNYSDLGPGQIGGHQSGIGLYGVTIDDGNILVDEGMIFCANLTRTGGTIQLDGNSGMRLQNPCSIGGTINVGPDAEFDMQWGSTVTLTEDAVFNNSGFTRVGGTLDNYGRIFGESLDVAETFNQKTNQVSQISELYGPGETYIHPNARLDLDVIWSHYVIVKPTGELKLDAVHPSDGTSVNASWGSFTIQSSGSDAGRVDLGKGALITEYPMSIMRQWIAAGYAGGTWTGDYIRSSAAEADSRLGIGYANADALYSHFPITWLGVTINNIEPALLIRTTLDGDGDLDGDVDFNDLLRIAQNYGLTSTGDWWLGDFNYDRNVNFNDLLMVAQNYGTSMWSDSGLVQSPTGSFESDWTLARSMVPEPSMIVLVGAGGLMGVWHRGKRRDKVAALS